MQAARAAFPEWRATPPLVRARALLRPEVPARRGEGRARAARHARQRQDDQGRRRRGGPRDRVRRGRDRHPVAHAGREPRGRLARDRLRHDPAADRRLRGDHPVQLPLHGPDVVPAVTRSRAGTRSSASPRSRTRSPSSASFELLDADRPAARRRQPRARRQGRPWTRSSSTRRSTASPSSARRRSRTTSTRRRAKNGKRVQALGGAKNHVIVMPDADLDSAVDGVLSSAFHAAGQRCLANSVCIAVGDVYEPLRAALAEKGEAMVVDDGSNPDAEVGPVISAASQERILGWIEKGVEQGGTLRPRRPRPRLRRGQLHRPDDHRVGAGGRDRARGDLRARAHAAQGRRHRRGARDPQRVAEGQRRVDLHDQRGRHATVPLRRAGRDARRQHRRRRADGLLPLHGLEGLVLRRPARATAATRSTSTPRRRS